MFCIHSDYLNLTLPFLFPFISSSSLEKTVGVDTLLLTVLWDVYSRLKKTDSENMFTNSTEIKWTF